MAASNPVMQGDRAHPECTRVWNIRFLRTSTGSFTAAWDPASCSKIRENEEHWKDKALVTMYANFRVPENQLEPQRINRCIYNKVH